MCVCVLGLTTLNETDSLIQIGVGLVSNLCVAVFPVCPLIHTRHARVLLCERDCVSVCVCVCS